MKNSLIALALMSMSLCATAQSMPEVKAAPVAAAPTAEKSSWMPKLHGPIAYPGNVWGTMVYSAHAPDGYPKYRIEGVVEQGADWFRYGEGDKWKFNTFVAAEYVINSDSKGVSPVIGMKTSRSFNDGNLDLGLRYKHGSTYLSPTGASNPGGTKSVGRVEIFATYWFAWNLAK